MDIQPAQQADRSHPEGQRRGGQHDAEARRQQEEQPCKYIGKPKADHGQRLAAAFLLRCALRLVKLCRQYGRVAQPRGDLLLKEAVRQLQVKVLLILLQNVRASATFRFSSSSFSLFRNSAFFMVVILLQKHTDSLGEPQLLRPIHVI